MTRMTRWVLRRRVFLSVMTMPRVGSLWRPIRRNFISAEQTVSASCFQPKRITVFTAENDSPPCKGVAY